MYINLYVHYPLLIVGVLVGFYSFILYFLRFERNTNEENLVTGNEGSVMNYCLSFLTAYLIFKFGSLLLLYVSMVVLVLSPTETSYVILPFWAAVCGAILARPALLRAKDAGKRNAFALLGLIPVANLALFLAPPVRSAARPPYVPENRFLRIAIGLGALALIVLVNEIVALALVSLHQALS